MPAGSAWRVLRPPGQPVSVRPQQRLGEKDMRPRAPDAANLRFCAEGKFDGIYLGSPSITT
jgi:hypothetical protein